MDTIYVILKMIQKDKELTPATTEASYFVSVSKSSTEYDTNDDANDLQQSKQGITSFPSFWNASNPMFLFTIKHQILFEKGTLRNLSYDIFHFEPSSSFNSFRMFAKVLRYKDRKSLKNWKRKKIGSKNATYRNSYQLVHLDYPVEISKTIPPSSKDLL